MLQLCVLGELTAEIDGRRIELPADARARELLGWLAVAPGAHSRSALAGRLRPDVAEESARKTLRDAIYELRRALGPEGRDAIVATREQVGLDADLVRADLWDAREAPEGADGQLLAGLGSDWVLSAREE